jgi:hypothetical protein
MRHQVMPSEKGFVWTPINQPVEVARREDFSMQRMIRAREHMQNEIIPLFPISR